MNVEYVWAVTSYTSVFLIMILTSVCLTYFVKPYLRQQKAAVGTGIAYFAVMLMLYIIPIQVGNFTAYLCGMLAAFLFMLVCERENPEQKLFLAMTFFSLRWLATAIAAKIDSLLYMRLVNTEKMAVNEWQQYGSYVVTRMIDILLAFFILLSAVAFVNKSYLCKKEKLDGRELAMLVTPSVCAVTGYAILQFYMEIYERDTGKNLSEVYGIYTVLAVLYYLVSIISIVVTVILVQNWKDGQKKKAEERLLQSQLDSMREHIGEVEKLQANVRLLRHDMGNHLQVMRALLEKGEQKEASAYMDSMQKKWQDTTPEIRSGHPVTDIILTEKKNKAAQKNISFICDFQYPQTGEADAFDVSVILNNALDNCLEHTGGDKPYIRVRSYRRESVFLIEIENSCVEKIRVNDETGLPVSTKRETGHGVGLISIKKTAGKYLGDLTFESGHGKVVLTVMLQLKA